MIRLMHRLALQHAPSPALCQPTAEVYAVAFHSDGTRVASAARDGAVWPPFDRPKALMELAHRCILGVEGNESEHLLIIRGDSRTDAKMARANVLGAGKRRWILCSQEPNGQRSLHHDPSNQFNAVRTCLRPRTDGLGQVRTAKM